MCKIVSFSPWHHQQRSHVSGKIVWCLLGVRYHLFSILKLVSCILVHIDDLRENLIIFSFCFRVKVRCRSVSHFTIPGKHGCFWGVFSSEYVLERAWGRWTVPEQYS